MTNFDALMDKDANGYLINGPLPFLVKKTMTFAGGTTNDPGDYDGTGNPATLFDVTGDVLVSNVIAVCRTSLVGNTATLSVGTTETAPYFISAITATDVDADTVYIGADSGTELQLDNSLNNVIAGYDIIQTIATANITAGVIDYYLFWRPLSQDGRVVAA